jgi:hypothetical protein
LAWVIGNHKDYFSTSCVRRPDFEDLEVYKLAERLAIEIWQIMKG